MYMQRISEERTEELARRMDKFSEFFINNDIDIEDEDHEDLFWYLTLEWNLDNSVEEDRNDILAIKHWLMK